MTNYNGRKWALTKFLKVKFSQENINNGKKYGWLKQN